MNKLIHYFNRDYPINTNWKHQLRLAFIIGLSIAIFLIVFQPFGLSAIDSEHQTAIIGGYGIVCFLTLVLNLIVLPHILAPFFKEEKWTIWRQLLFLIWIIFTIGFGNAIYTKLVFSMSSPFWILLLRFQLVTLTVGILPVLVATIASQNIHLKKNLVEAQHYQNQKTKQNKENTTITIIAENGKDSFQTSLINLLYIASEGNYIQVCCAHENRVEKTLIRNTLTNTEKQLINCHSILKTHRAYLVNLKNITAVSGNSQGLKLHFSQTELQAPVSRSYLKNFRESYQNNQP